MLRINEISKTFDRGSVNEKRALHRISLSLDEGEFVTVIGGNGAGKSTLINCIAGIHQVDTGSIILDGMDITFSPEYKRSRMIGRVFQDPLLGTAFDMTIAENLAIAWAKGKSHGLTAGITRADLALFRERLALLDLGLEERINQKVKLLSGGERQALTLLMATMARPKLLLLDEHTASLDPAIAKKVLYLTSKFVSEEKLTTIMITHNMKAALEYGSRTIMMHEGEIILDLAGEERAEMTVERLIKYFESRSGTRLENDRLLLA
ncbi:MAG TPA: ATP-binding cassette domain-containing protein [Bacillota bacterium]|jgi:putative ABC transport system ATP-binding protein|nr:ATP-binding cassette domain-containing protein [Bacillota bacterium]HOA35406.1 ATP-binding cassette domain-containing protein [Bacillota bacterium]HOJ85271.1 ATP-binding cassette domain-containing protein [Bacillota bacterium]HOL15117.1 ATP-binding cassette domain-containing protein [Bacillota bacterium]HPZ11571.1 ATP-binding cassette domain-containing protein [Bacillota bacterium]